MTVPAAEACIGVPVGTAMSIPSCIRPQRQPNGLVTGPETGHDTRRGVRRRGRPTTTSRRLGGLDLGGDRCALCLQRVDLAGLGLLLRRQRVEADLLLLAGGRQRALVRDQLLLDEALSARCGRRSPVSRDSIDARAFLVRSRSICTWLRDLRTCAAMCLSWLPICLT